MLELFADLVEPLDLPARFLEMTLERALQIG